VLVDRASRSKGLGAISSHISSDWFCCDLNACGWRSIDRDKLLLDFIVHSSFSNTIDLRQGIILLLSLAAFWLHEGTFLLTVLLLICLVTRVHSSAGHRHERLFVAVAALLLIAVLVYQVHFVIYPLYPDDRAHILRGLLHFEFLYVDGHFNLPLITGCLAMVALSLFGAFRKNWPSAAAAVRAKLLIIVWLSIVLIAILVAIFVEQSFSAFAQLQARYHPVFVSAALGGR
jgi:hypothetical protein